MQRINTIHDYQLIENKDMETSSIENSINSMRSATQLASQMERSVAEINTTLEEFMRESEVTTDERKTIESMRERIVTIKIETLKLISTYKPKLKPIIRQIQFHLEGKQSFMIKMLKELNSDIIDMVSNIITEAINIESECSSVDISLKTRKSVLSSIGNSIKSNLWWILGFSAIGILIGGIGFAAVGMTVLEAVFAGGVVAIAGSLGVISKSVHNGIKNDHLKIKLEEFLLRINRFKSSAEKVKKSAQEVRDKTSELREEINYLTNNSEQLKTLSSLIEALDHDFDILKNNALNL